MLASSRLFILKPDCCDTTVVFVGSGTGLNGVWVVLDGGYFFEVDEGDFGVGLGAPDEEQWWSSMLLTAGCNILVNLIPAMLSNTKHTPHLYCHIDVVTWAKILTTLCLQTRSKKYNWGWK